MRTQELLARLLPPPPATVLDVGGGTGVHADWLAQRGYSVHVIDPVEEHVTLAGRIPNVSSAVADARCVSQADESQDAVLPLGPLYHLPEREGRFQALREARRVARPGAPVVAADFTTAYFHLPDELAQDLVDAGLRDVEVYGIEGPAGPTLRALGMDCLDERLDAAVRAARIVERDPMMIAASGHLLAVGRV